MYKYILELMVEKEFYTVKEFSKVFNVCEQTIRTLIRIGRLRAFRSGSGKRSPFRIPTSEITRFQVMGMHEMNPNLECEDS